MIKVGNYRATIGKFNKDGLSVSTLSIDSYSVIYDLYSIKYCGHACGYWGHKRRCCRCYGNEPHCFICNKK